MKKLTAGIFATLLAVVSTGAANAEIASKGYVDQQVGTKADAATVSSLQGTVSGHTSQIGTINDTIGGYGDIVTHDASEFATSAQGALADTAVQPSDITNVERTTNKTITLSGTSTDAQYPSAKAVWDTIQAETEGIASSGDLDELGTRVTTAEGEIDTLQTQMATKQDKLSQTGSASQPVYVDATGKVTAGNTIPTVTTTIAAGQTGAAQAGAVATALAGKANTADLGDLATLDAVGSAQITDGAVATADIASKAVTKEKLAEDIVTSLGKADTALQQASLNGYLTKTAADAAYADIATETTASSASTNAQTALTRIGTLTDLTTDAKTNTVVAINEVASEAAAAATAASAADGKAVAAQGAAEAAQGAAEAAQGDVDALEVRVGTAESDIDGIQGQLENMATSETVSGLQTTVTNLQSTKQDKTDNTLTTTSKTVVGAIDEVKKQADKGVSDAATAQSAASAADSKAQAAQSAASAADSKAQAAQAAAEAAQETADAAIPAPDGECASGTAKCVLTFNNSVYAWEVIARNGEGQ